ncbi:hypothetical protein BGZ60DRAFT_518746 [Tricladium varicosporioides]|nr:hypothetical protein BGZ60DRAFT_518746 [Hymenoscyphus varicosporioides]
MATDDSLPEDVGNLSPAHSFSTTLSSTQSSAQAVSPVPIKLSASIRHPSFIQTPNGIIPAKAGTAPSPSTPPLNGCSKRIMCCRNVIPHKAPITSRSQTTPALPGEGPDTTLDQYSLFDFKNYAAGRFPDRVIIPAATPTNHTPIRWTLFKLIFCVVSSASRGTHACKSIDFYGIPPAGAEMVHIEYVEEIFPEVVAISGCFDRGDELLIRVGCGLEWSCKRHLDTIYTVYVCRYKPAGQYFNMPIKTLDPPILCEQMLEAVGAARDLVAGRQPGSSPRSLDVDEMRNQTVQHQGLMREDRIAEFVVNQRALIEKKAEIMHPRILKPEDRVNAEAILIPPNRRPQEMIPPKGATQKFTPQIATPKNISPNKGYSEPWGPNGERLQKCSKQKRYLPPEDFDINLKTGTYYGHCRSLDEDEEGDEEDGTRARTKMWINYVRDNLTAPPLNDFPVPKPLFPYELSKVENIALPADAGHLDEDVYFKFTKKEELKKIRARMVGFLEEHLRLFEGMKRVVMVLDCGCYRFKGERRFVAPYPERMDGEQREGWGKIVKWTRRVGDEYQRLHPEFTFLDLGIKVMINSINADEKKAVFDFSIAPYTTYHALSSRETSMWVSAASTKFKPDRIGI